MMADLNQMLDKHRRGEDTTEDFAEFMRNTENSSPTDPRPSRNSSTTWHAGGSDAAHARLALPEQREELAGLMEQAWQDLDLASEMAQLQDHLRALRPDLPWNAVSACPVNRGSACRTPRRHSLRWPT